MQLKIAAIFLGLWTISVLAAETDIKYYRPFDHIAQYTSGIVSGQCTQQSTRIKREDAWRCVANNRLYDPCFVKQYGDHKTALCPATPWGGTSVRIALTQAADNNRNQTLDISRTYPWAMELDSGEKCQVIDAGTFYQQMPVRYMCTGKSILFGHLQRCKAPWSILKRKSNQVVEVATIRKVWY